MMAAVALFMDHTYEEAESKKEYCSSQNPDCRVVTHKTFFLPETQAEFDFSQYDYVVDAIDKCQAQILRLHDKSRWAKALIL